MTRETFNAALGALVASGDGPGREKGDDRVTASTTAQFAPGPRPDPAVEAAALRRVRDANRAFGVTRGDVLDKVVIRGGCWLWTHSYDSRDGRPRWRCTSATRVVYRALVGPIPPGHVVTATCSNRAYCVNPEHLVVKPTTRTTSC